MFSTISHLSRPLDWLFFGIKCSCAMLYVLLG